MIVFNSDLDNTLIYSYKHDIGTKKRCVEIYQNREVSFITERTFELLRQVKERFLFVPTTTRTIEQYERIDLGVGIPEFALVCNGGVLLKNGEEDIDWYSQSLNLIADCGLEFSKAEKILKKDPNRTFEIRNIKDLFVFSKSDRPLESVQLLKDNLNVNLVDIFSNGVKVYVVPKKLSKGNAIMRFKERVKADYILAAGDSEFDISMLNVADLAIAPKILRNELYRIDHTIITEDNFLFSEALLEVILSLSSYQHSL